MTWREFVEEVSIQGGIHPEDDIEIDFIEVDINVEPDDLVVEISSQGRLMIT
jgi:hypothetical protein